MKLLDKLKKQLSKDKPLKDIFERYVKIKFTSKDEDKEFSGWICGLRQEQRTKLLINTAKTNYTIHVIYLDEIKSIEDLDKTPKFFHKYK